MERPKGYSASIRENLNPSARDMSGWQSDARHWSVTVRNSRGVSFSFKYHTGPAITGRPTFKDVMYAVISDAAFYDQNPTLEEFRRESGFDYDDPELERAYKACKRTSERLLELLGDDYDAMAEYVAE